MAEAGEHAQATGRCDVDLGEPAADEVKADQAQPITAATLGDVRADVAFRGCESGELRPAAGVQIRTCLSRRRYTQDAAEDRAVEQEHALVPATRCGRVLLSDDHPLAAGGDDLEQRARVGIVATDVKDTASTHGADIGPRPSGPDLSSKLSDLVPAHRRPDRDVSEARWSAAHDLKLSVRAASMPRSSCVGRSSPMAWATTWPSAATKNVTGKPATPQRRPVASPPSRTLG